ncbi:alpha/beta fold hydrolase [Alkalihalobacillus sp. AL-G]|uniref:alpha/beta fold hydrolase n=1 Tax=Alkalihalobacillus sp. AL-G TaxID=2926399 RepID=UPI00351B80C9
MSFQKDLATLSTNSKHIIVKDAGHAIHIDRPQAVTDAIKEMLVMIKGDQKLAVRVHIVEFKLAITNREG